MSLEDYIHNKWMRRAINLAALGEGCTSPNPMVGAIILDKLGNLISEGFHEKSGLQHAEAMAFSNLKGNPIDGSLYVNLEPCCHQGKTPPCVDKIIASGIKKVFVSIKDPDKRVAGKGIQLLKDAGIEVHLGLCEKESIELNKSFIHKNIKGYSYGVLKWAMSLDGRLGLRNGESKWITNECSRAYVHKLRAEFDAVIIGGNTMRKDNPILTSRGIKRPEPLRVVFSRSLNLPLAANLWDTNMANTMVICNASSANEEFLKRIPSNVTVEMVPSDNPMHVSKLLAKKGCNKILWECGPKLATAAVKAKCIQEFVSFIGPKIVGGDNCMTPFSDFNFTDMNQVMNLDLKDFKLFGDDIYVKSLINAKLGKV